MKNIPADLIKSLTAPTSTPAVLWIMERTDGLKLGFSDSDIPLSYAGVDFVPNFGMTPSAIEARSGFSTDNLDVQTVLDSDSITEVDIRGGLWDGAKIDVWRIDRRHPEFGHEIIRTGYLGEIKTGRQSFYAEVRGLTQLVQTTVGRTYQAGCDADLGDTRCKFIIATMKQTGSVTEGFLDRFVDSASTLPDEYFSYGHVTFTSGRNAGRTFEIQAFADKVFKLYIPVPDLIGVGDTYDAWPGCDKTIKTCRERFNNKKNFRGFPFIPGQDKLYAAPEQSQK